MGKLKLPRLNISCIFGYKFLLDFGSNTEKSNFTQSVKAVTFSLLFNALNNVIGTLGKGVSEPRIKVVENVLSASSKRITKRNELWEM